jgi:hypothetical protein
MKEDMLLIIISILFITVLEILIIKTIDYITENECSNRQMKNPPEYCVEFWKEQKKEGKK